MNKVYVVNAYVPNTDFDVLIRAFSAWGKAQDYVTKFYELKAKRANTVSAAPFKELSDRLFELCKISMFSYPEDEREMIIQPVDFEA